jgi:hypothetical protein
MTTVTSTESIRIEATRPGNRRGAFHKAAQHVAAYLNQTGSRTNGQGVIREDVPEIVSFHDGRVNGQGLVRHI